MPIETKKEMHNELVDEQRNSWMQALQGERKHIDNAKKYVGQQDTSWWDLFFSDQQGINDNSFTSNWSLQIPFTWSIQHSPSSQTPPHGPNANLENLLHPQQRDIYAGSRMTKATNSARWQGKLQEMKVGMLIATPTDDNDLGDQFWIGKVLDVVMDENQN